MKQQIVNGLLLLSLVGYDYKPLTNNQNTLGNAEIGETQEILNAKVDLIKTGDNPTKELRFKPVVNSRETITMTMNMDITMTVNDQKAPTFYSPSIIMTMEVNITDIKPNGDIHANFKYTDIDIVENSNTSSQTTTAMETQMSQLLGFEGTFIIDRLGNNKETNFDIPDTLDLETKQMLQQMLNSLKQISYPLPLESVGIGATWQDNQSLKINGIDLKQDVKYIVTNIEGDIISLEVVVTQTGESQKIEMPNAPEGSSIELLSLSSKGDGIMTIDLTKMMPISSVSKINSNTEIKIEEPNNSGTNIMKTNMNMKLNLESK